MGVPILISLGAKLAALKTFYGWVAWVTIVCIHVHECPSRHRHQEERSVLQFFFVAPHAACRSCAQRSHQTQLCSSLQDLCVGNCGISICARASVCARCGSPWCISSFYLRVAGGVLGRENHASVGSDILLWSRPGKVDTCTTAGEGKSMPITGSTRGANPSARSAQIKGAVRVHQESLIRYACSSYV